MSFRPVPLINECSTVSVARISLTSDAKVDLIGIRRFTAAQWGETQSQKYLTDLRQALRLIAEIPSIGVLSHEIGQGVRGHPHGSHIIYYMLHQGDPVVFGVLHRRMAPLNHLMGRITQ